jgi:two-component system response regulator VicR
MADKRKILIIDDEKPIVDILKFNLDKDYDVAVAYDGKTGIEKARDFAPDVILLDVMLPEVSGFEVCKTLRPEMQASIIMLTARDDEVDKVLGLDLGADDYITKPFSMKELLARIKANMRRAVKDEPDDETMSLGNIVFDLNRYELYKNGKLVDLTVREFELVKFLASKPNKIFSREELLKQVWDYKYYGDLRTVDVTVRRIREKLEDDPSTPRYILTKRGVGYYFCN